MLPATDHRPAQLRVLIIDPHEVSRAAIRALLRTEGLEVVGDMASADQVIASADVAGGPDVVLLDIGNAPDAARHAAATLGRLPCAPTVVLTASVAPISPIHGFAFIAKGEICARRLRRAMRPEQPPSNQEPRMSMQAYYDGITAKTGKTPAQLIELARAAGLVAPGIKPGQVVAWLKDNYGLGHGHAMAIVATIKHQTQPAASADEKVDRHFNGKRAGWRPVYDGLVHEVAAFGPDTDVHPGATYMSLRRAGKKFAIVQVTAERLDIGIKLKDAPADERFQAAGSWNQMVTHRVRIHQPDQVDAELLTWLRRAYTSA